MTRRRPNTLAALCLALAACTTSTSPEEAPAAAPPPAPARLALDLPSAVHVWVDGERQGVTPLPELSLPPGPHEVNLVTKCRNQLLQVELTSGATTRIDRSRAKDLVFASLKLDVRSLGGTPLRPNVHLNDDAIVVPFDAKPGPVELTVPACAARLAVDSPPLGGFREDITFKPNSTTTRTLVLAPGSPMIRIAGGPFTIGPPKRLTEGDHDDYWDTVPRYPLQIATFDLDQHEVTTAEYVTCQKAAKRPYCMSTQECAEAVGCTHPVTWPAIESTDTPDLRYCTSSGYPKRKVIPGKENHPMNCISHVEAEIYCKWVGKRLPTDVEWEYAARSRKEEYMFPWGNHHVPAPGRENEPRQLRPGSTVPDWGSGYGRTRTFEICSYPPTNSEQGICDLLGNAEQLTVANPPYRPQLHDDIHDIWKFSAGGGAGAIRQYDFLHNRQEFDFAFRCAKNVPAGEVP